MKLACRFGHHRFSPWALAAQGMCIVRHCLNCDLEQTQLLEPPTKDVAP